MKLKVQRYGAYEDSQKRGTYLVWDNQTNGYLLKTESLIEAKAFAYDQNKIATASDLNGVWE